MGMQPTNKEVKILKIILTWKNAVERPAQVVKKLSRNFLLRFNYRGIYCCNHILRIAYPEHLKIL